MPTCINLKKFLERCGIKTSNDPTMPEELRDDMMELYDTKTGNSLIKLCALDENSPQYKKVKENHETFSVHRYDVEYHDLKGNKTVEEILTKYMISTTAINEKNMKMMCRAFLLDL